MLPWHFTARTPAKLTLEEGVTPSTFSSNRKPIRLTISSNYPCSVPQNVMKKSNRGTPFLCMCWNDTRWMWPASGPALSHLRHLLLLCLSLCEQRHFWVSLLRHMTISSPMLGVALPSSTSYAFFFCQGTTLRKAAGCGQTRSVGTMKILK